MYRTAGQGFEVLLVHPGGPFWARRDLGSWSIPKGEFDDAEDPLVAARREFTEEIGSAPPEGDYALLGKVRQTTGKVIHAFTLESNFNLEKFHSNMFTMEWPPKSGQKQEFPENDKAAWMPLPAARRKIIKGQLPLLGKLADKLGQSLEGADEQSTQSSLF